MDSGSEICALPPTAADRLKGSSTAPLRAANGSLIRVYGEREITVYLNNRPFRWTFSVADVTEAIIGADFLGHYGWLIDLANHRLFQAGSFASVPARSALGNSPGINSLTAQPPPDISKLLSSFPQLTTLTFSANTVRHGVQLHIPTTGPPVHAKVRRLEPEKFRIAREAFRTMEGLGIVQCSSSAWSSPLHMVRKDDGSWRPCGDFQRLNTVTTPDRYPVPHM